MKVLITGASGFIGKAIVPELELIQNVKIIKLSRVETEGFTKSPRLTADSDWKEVLVEVDVVIHLAGLAHVTTSPPSIESFMETNCFAALNFASQCKELGVKKFIFFSSIGVHAGKAQSEVITSESDFAPIDNYAKSKVEAEKGLKAVFDNSSCELIILRPPLVYGSNAPGNFRTLLKIAEKRLPLPIASVNNQRSLLSVRNLADLLKKLILTPKNMSGAYVVCDNESISTGKIITLLSDGMGLKGRLFKFPLPLLKLFALCIGKVQVLEKVCGNFVIDGSRISERLDWEPPYNTENEITKAGIQYKNSATIDAAK